MTTQTPAKINGTPATQKTAATIRPFSSFAPDPFRNFALVRHMMESLFGATMPADFQNDLEPATNLYEKDGTYTLECAVPGYKKDDITIQARGDQVTVSGSFSQEKSEDKNDYHRKEMRRGTFSRSVVLPQEVDPERVAAKLEDGVLKITLHPTKTIKSKTIPITG